MAQTVSYEEVLKWTGDLGVYQIVIFVYMACYIFSSTEVIYMNFVGYKMDHWCKVPELANFSFEIQKHVAIPYSANSSDGKVSYESCKMFDLNYSSYSQEDFLNWHRPQDVNTIDCTQWVFDQSVYPYSIVNEWELVCGKNWQVDFVSTMTMTGYLFGSIFGGALSDRFGRVRAMGIGVTVKLAANLFSTLAPNYIAFVIARFFVGFGTQYCYVVGFVLTIENIGAAHRPWMGIAYSIFFSLGFAAVPLFALACRHWRDLQIVMTVPVAIFLLTVWFLPESPRWLMSRGKLTEAEAGIRLIAEVNKRHLPEDFKVTDIKIEGEKEGGKKATFMDLFKSPKIRKYSFVQFVIWFSVNLIYYALSLNAGTLAGDVFLNTSLLGLVEIPACVLCFIAMGLKIMGRKRTLAIANLVGGVACLICVPIIIADEDSMAVTVLSLVGKAGGTAAFNGFYVYTSEIYPTEVRNVGLGACSMVARISGIAAPYIGGIFGDIWSPMPSLIFGVVGIVSGVLTFLLPETFGKSLPETIEELEQGALDTRKLKSEMVKDVSGVPMGDGTSDTHVSTLENSSKIDHESGSNKKGIVGSENNAYENFAFVEKF